MRPPFLIYLISKFYSFPSRGKSPALHPDINLAGVSVLFSTSWGVLKHQNWGYPGSGVGGKERDFLTDKGVTLTQLDFSTATAAGPGAALESSAWPSGVPLISGGSKQSKEPQKGHWDFLQTSAAFFINLQLSALGQLGKWRRKERGEKINPKQNARISLCILQWQEKGTRVWI